MSSKSLSYLPGHHSRLKLPSSFGSPYFACAIKAWSFDRFTGFRSPCTILRLRDLKLGASIGLLDFAVLVLFISHHHDLGSFRLNSADKGLFAERH